MLLLRTSQLRHAGVRCDRVIAIGTKMQAGGTHIAIFIALLRASAQRDVGLEGTDLNSEGEPGLTECGHLTGLRQHSEDGVSEGAADGKMRQERRY